MTFSPGTGYDGGLAQGVFSVGLQGVGEADVPLRLAKIDQVGGQMMWRVRPMQTCDLCRCCTRLPRKDSSRSS